LDFLNQIKKILFNKWSVVAVFVGIILIVSSNLIITNCAKNFIYSDLNEVPETKVALILGTSRYTTKGYTNLFFKYRIQAVVELYKAGKIKHIIVSGDNSITEYNEPREMRKALINEGIPFEAITLDYAGFRTLDSVVRCKEVFDQDNFIIISQKFHIERALFIAQKFDIHAIGYAAQDPPDKYSFKTNVREYFARTKAIFDLYILHTQPKFLGEKENINL